MSNKVTTLVLYFSYSSYVPMITWRANINPCIFRSKNDKKNDRKDLHSSGRRILFVRRIPDADDIGIVVLFDNRNHLVVGLVSIVEQFDRFRTKIHTGVLKPRENQNRSLILLKTILILQHTWHITRWRFIRHNLEWQVHSNSPEILYLGSMISSDSSDIKKPAMHSVHSECPPLGPKLSEMISKEKSMKLVFCLYCFMAQKVGASLN